MSLFDHDEFMLAIAGATNGRRGGNSNNLNAPTPDVLTGAAISGAKLFIVTLERSDGGFTIVERQTAVHELIGRDAASVDALSLTLQTFFGRAGIRHVVLRASPEAGPYAANPSCYKVETVLQLIPELTVELVNTLSVGSWIRREDPTLPGPWIDGGVRLRQAQIRAVEMAAFAIMNCHDRRYFPKGAMRS